MNESVLQKTFTIPNKLGLHARPVVVFVKALQPFKCAALVAKGDIEVNGRSVLGLMSLAAEYGSQVRVTLTGKDAPAAMAAIEKVFADKFDEE